MATSTTDIYNLALRMLGAAPVTGPSDNSKNARALNDVYDLIRQGELRKKPYWNFSIQMFQLAASATTPLFDRAFSYPLPAGFLAMAPSYAESNYNDKDWLIQQGQIFTKFDGPLNVRLVMDVTDTSLMDPLFAQALAAQLALTLCDSITQSNSKIQIAETRYEKVLAEARRSNAFDNVAAVAPEDRYITVRL